jgi:cytochrome c553
MKKILVTLLVIASTSLMAASGVSLARNCVGCHGVNFEKAALGRSDIVKGWSAERIESALISFKTTTESDEIVMKNQVSNFSNEQIKSIAKYISNIK